MNCSIAFLLRFYPLYGGGETVTLSLSNELAKRDYNVHIIYFQDNGWDKSPFIDKRVKAHKIDGIDIGKFHYSTAHTQNVQRVLYSIIDEQKIDILINQWWPLCYVQDVSKRCNVKLISCFHMNILQKRIHRYDKFKEIIKSLFWFYFDKRVAELRAKALLPEVYNSDKYVFLSKYFIDEFKYLTGYEDITGKLEYVNNPLPYHDYLHKEDISKKEKVVLFVGRVENAHKRVNIILKTWKLIERQDTDWRLLIVGTGTDLNKNINYAKSLGLKNVQFKGYDIPLEYYRKASVFVMTSHHEGWGMTLVEAQQNGVVPVVMDTFSSVHEIIENGKTGIIIKDLDIEGMAKAILYLIENKYFREKIAANCLDTCRKFDVSNIVDRWEMIFNKLLR